jgi:hypothetical protein
MSSMNGRLPALLATAWLGLPLLGAVGACAGRQKQIYGTEVIDSQDNRQILGVIEKYRVAVEKKDSATLLELASPNYWEDGGTPTGADDYGRDGLSKVLAERFDRADGIRYSMRYMGIKRVGKNRAAVDVLIDASYSIQTAGGVQRRDMRDQNELLLEYDGRNWKFLSGM